MGCLHRTSAYGALSPRVRRTSSGLRISLRLPDAGPLRCVPSVWGPSGSHRFSFSAGALSRIVLIESQGSISIECIEGGLPVPESPEVLCARSRHALMSRHRLAGDPERIDAARDYAELFLAQHIQAVVAKFPPLTNEQRDRLSALLAPERAA